MYKNESFPQSAGSLYISRQWSKYFNYGPVIQQI